VYPASPSPWIGNYSSILDKRVEKSCHWPENNAVPIDAKARTVISILAGGLSSRMGSDKSRLALGGLTLLDIIEKEARRWNPEAQIQVISQDLVERCGPLGGILTSFLARPEEWHLFLSCDMPFISCKMLDPLLASAGQGNDAVFWETTEGAGFPFLLSQKMQSRVEALRQQRRYSLQNLARQISAQLLDPAAFGLAPEAFYNVNTPEDFVAAESIFNKSNGATE
jgi:molybdopterin-guanine dinucleotide biosynthesis protein A